jgi:uncharacterized protein YbjT (DUF2867 family)
MSGSILVLGATGTVGRLLVPELLARGERVRAASRAGRDVAGAPGVAFDYEDVASVDGAFADADRVWALVPAGQLDSPRLLRPVVEAAARRGAKVVMMTAMGADADETTPYRRAERMLEASGAPWAVLRPNWFMDNFGTYWIEGIRRGEIALPAGEGRTSFIDARDIALAAAGALTSAVGDGQAWNLSGPEALTYAEAAAILSEATGRPIAYRATDDASFVAMMTGAGMPADYAGFLAAILGAVRAGHAAEVTDAVERLAGRPPRDLRTFARDHASALGAAGQAA